MFEELLVPGVLKVVQQYPNSGPGPTTLLKGDETIGYFGEVATADFITHEQYRAHLATAATWPLNTDLGWFKFMYHGKVIFMSKTWAFRNAAWQSVYSTGGIYGTNNNGAYPAGTATNQYKPYVFTKGGKSWTLVPRALRAKAADPAATSAETSGNETADLLFRILNAGSGYPNAGDFASYSFADVGMNVAHSVMNSATNTANNLIAGYSGIWNQSFQSLVKSNAAGYTQVWRAVFEVAGDPKAAV